MKIINWDKLRYKFITLAGMIFTIDTTYNVEENGKTIYCLTMADADDVGETLIEVFLKEGNFDEFLMTVNLPTPRTSPHIKRVFRKKDLLDMDVFLNQMAKELIKNSMVFSYITFFKNIKRK